MNELKAKPIVSGVDTDHRDEGVNGERAAGGTEFGPAVGDRQPSSA